MTTLARGYFLVVGLFSLTGVEMTDEGRKRKVWNDDVLHTGY